MKLNHSMYYLTKYTNLNFWQIIIYGGIILCLLSIFFMIIGFILAIPTDYGRAFAFWNSLFVGCLYVFTILFYFPIKILLELRKLKESIKENQKK